MKLSDLIPDMMVSNPHRGGTEAYLATEHYHEGWNDCREQVSDRLDAVLRARPIDEYHEDDGNVVWWAWEDGAWLGEPAWIGTPTDSDWPGYHTHWTPHPAQPEKGD
jgi:hypothetical protein